MTLMMQQEELAKEILPVWLPLCHQHDLSSLEFLHRGKRSFVFKAKQEGKEVVLKVPHPLHDVVARLRIEADMLKRVNILGLGPSLIIAGEHEGKDFVIEEFIAGESFLAFSERCDLQEWHIVAQRLLEQCFIMDKAGLTKEEMHRPFTNAIVTSEYKVVLIDFERMHPDTNPKNVRQCVQFLTGQRISERFHAPTKEMTILLLQQYSEALGKYHEKKVPEALFEKIFFSIRDMVL